MADTYKKEGVLVDGGPTWISHRGYKDSAVENTAKAFQAACDLGFVHLETDLRITQDDEIVLIHDQDLKRLCGRPDLVRRLTRSQLAQIALGDGQSLLFFDQFAKQFAGYGWTLDIKPEGGERVVAKLLKWIEEHNSRSWFEEQVNFLIWRSEQEVMVRECLPHASFYANKVECYRAGLALLGRVPFLGGIKSGRTYAVPEKLGPLHLFQKWVVRAFHDYGAKAIAFLPDTEGAAKQAVEAGFDEVLTNEKIVV